MQEVAIRALLINASRDQYVRMVQLLESVSTVNYELTWCADYDFALEAMLAPVHDVIMLDFEHAPAICSELLAAARSHDCHTPIICLALEADEALDQSAIRQGAADYLLKNDLDPRSLERSIRYAIDRKSTESELARLAHYDLLTGIPNRLLFNDRLDRALQRVDRGNIPFALLYIDLDGFKSINDKFGHDKGDLLVQGIAKRLTGCIRRIDTIARIGGDEFVALLERVSSTNDVVTIAQKVIDVVTEPFDIGEMNVRVGCSIGIAVYPDAGTDAKTLLRHADMAMYEAKGIAGSNYRFYSDKMNNEVENQEQLQGELSEAISDDQLCLYYQPRISLRTGKVIGVEALLRWEHPRRGTILPGEIISLAKQSGLMTLLGYWTLNRLCSDTYKMNEANVPPLKIAINVSLAQLEDENFSETVAIILSNNKVNPARVELEFAEPELLENIDLVRSTMQELKDKGLSFSLDDYGTGVSSLPQLQSLPINHLKIDACHIQRIDEEAGAKVVNAMISIAHELGMQVIAEGVESETQKEHLVNMHCDQMQGYLFSAPLPFDEFIGLLQNLQVTSRRSYLSVIDES